MDCEKCGEPATHVIDSWDACPTDRGVEYRFCGLALCNDCDPETKQRNEFADFFMDKYLTTMREYGYPRGRR